VKGIKAEKIADVVRIDMTTGGPTQAILTELRLLETEVDAAGKNFPGLFGPDGLKERLEKAMNTTPLQPPV